MRLYDDASALNFTRFVPSGSCCALATQNGTRAATTAASARSLAIRSAVPPVVHPICQKPKVMIATAPMTPPQIPGLTHTGLVMIVPPLRQKGDLLRRE